MKYISPLRITIDQGKARPPTSGLKISLFGTFSTTFDEQVIRAFETDKTRALLAYLAVEQGQVHRRESLATLLWPEFPDDRARQNLSQALYSLRLLLGDKQPRGSSTPVDGNQPLPFLLAQPNTLQINPQADLWVDVTAFTRSLENGKRHAHPHLRDCPACLAELDAAVTLYRGEFLAGFSLRDSQVFDEWALVQRERLRRLAQETLDLLANCRDARGELELALTYAWRQVEMEPLWEHAQRRLIDLLARSRRRDAALEQYEAFRQILQDELGMPPEGATTALYERLRNPKTPAAPPSTHKHNLPTPLTPFLGRSAELAGLNAYLNAAACRLITIVGPGGSGKTRLALEAACSQGEQFHAGAWLVSLAPLSATEAIPAAIAAALGLPLQEQPEPLQQLKDYLRAKNALLVLDSCEHLLEGANLVLELLREAPELKVLATSRGRLNVQGEQLFPLGGLEVPPPDIGLDLARQCESVQLFVSAGGRARPGFDLSLSNLASVAHICALVEGMPLGLLLAAAWLDTFSTAEVAAEIELGLDFLSADWEGLPARQRSLRATFDYSWRLLAKTEQQALRRLSVFRGGFNRQAVGQVAGASPQDLRTLVEKSMLERLPSGRYGIHELLRQYAREKLAENPAEEAATRERHAASYLGRLPGWAQALKGSRQGEALGEMDVDSGNLSAAWNWASKQGMVDDLSQGLEGFCLYYDLRSRLQEGQLVCRFALEHPSRQEGTVELVNLQASLWIWQAHFQRIQGDVQAAEGLLGNGKKRIEQLGAQDEGTRGLQAFWHFEQGYLINNLNERLKSFQSCASLYRGQGEDWWLAKALFWLVELNIRIGDLPAAHRASIEAVERSRILGEPRTLGRALESMATWYLYTGQIRKGQDTMEEAADLYRSIGDFACREYIAFALSVAYGWNGRFDEACLLLQEGLDIFRKQGHHRKQCFALMGLGLNQIHLGKVDLARITLEEGLELAIAGKYHRERAAIQMLLGQTALFEGDYVQARELAKASVTIHRQLSYANELVPAQATLAIAKCLLGQFSGAWNSVYESLQIGLASETYLVGLYALPAAALLLARSGQGDRAANVLAQTLQEPFVNSSHWFPVVLGEVLMDEARRLMAEREPPMEEQERVQSLMASVACLLEELKDLDHQDGTPSPEIVPPSLLP